MDVGRADAEMSRILQTVDRGTGAQLGRLTDGGKKSRWGMVDPGQRNRIELNRTDGRGDRKDRKKCDEFVYTLHLHPLTRLTLHKQHSSDSDMEGVYLGV